MSADHNTAADVRDLRAMLAIMGIADSCAAHSVALAAVAAREATVGDAAHAARAAAMQVGTYPGDDPERVEDTTRYMRGVVREQRRRLAAAADRW